MFTQKERLKHYLKKAYKKKTIVKFSKGIKNIIKEQCLNPNIYFNDLKKHFERYCNKYKKNEKSFDDIKFISCDVNTDYKNYIITKTRPINSKNNILMNLNINRHWDGIEKVKNNDISWKNKDDKLIWRGTTTGKWSSSIGRKALVSKYYNHPNQNIDVGLSFIVQNVDYKEENKYVKNIIYIQEQLKSKYIISVEGNDVATNLKWILYSNSVVIMPKPTIESWIMESKLIPWYHYVPVKNDFTDLEEIYKWCINNSKKCEKIALNGKEYINQFLDEKNEEEITNELLKRYFKNVIYI
jgi:hypothetical protein